MRQAGLTPRQSGELECPFSYPDAETACRALTSSGSAVRIIQHVGEERLRNTILDALEPYRLRTGGYRTINRFRFVVASG
jgi:hypothetical protein